MRRKPTGLLKIPREQDTLDSLGFKPSTHLSQSPLLLTEKGQGP